ncbi:MAG: hypothetical protein ACRDPL_14410 [Propionibacteriaceae bacterium]
MNLIPDKFTQRNVSNVLGPGATRQGQAMNQFDRARANIDRHRVRQYENEILRARSFPSLGHYFDVAAEIRAIRLRDAEAALAAMSN